MGWLSTLVLEQGFVLSSISPHRLETLNGGNVLSGLKSLPLELRLSPPGAAVGLATKFLRETPPFNSILNLTIR